MVYKSLQFQQQPLVRITYTFAIVIDLAQLPINEKDKLRVSTFNKK